MLKSTLIPLQTLPLLPILTDDRPKIRRDLAILSGLIGSTSLAQAATLVVFEDGGGLGRLCLLLGLWLGCEGVQGGYVWRGLCAAEGHVWHGCLRIVLLWGLL